MTIHINNVEYTNRADREDGFHSLWVVTVALWLSLLPGVRLLAFVQHS